MQLSISTSKLQGFLLAVKKAAYATLGDDMSVAPLLPDSRQLEYRDGELLYRDIYVGVLRFAGQEVVYLDGRAVWSMSYAGGIYTDVETPTAGQIYAFLRHALCNAPAELPLRGPRLLTRDAMHYTCQSTGSIEQFHGAETITNGTQCLYRLHFSGGTLV